MRVKHTNNGKCPKCAEFLKDAEQGLREWFEAEQFSNPTVHVSCSVRGKAEQEAAKKIGASKASYGQSPHNYRPALALDLFFIINGNASWIMSMYKEIADRLPDQFRWGADWNDNGRTDDEKFKDAPHFEYKDWKKRAKNYPNGDV